jgi:L-arabinose isomerase
LVLRKGRTWGVTTPEKPRIIVLAPYWDFWEHTIGTVLRGDRALQAHRVAELLSDEYNVAYVGQLTAPDPASAIGRRLADGPVIDAILVLSSLAVPPRTSTALLDQLPGIPVVIWAVYDSNMQVGPSFDHGRITSNGATVGAPMLASALLRSRSHVDVLLGRADDESAIRRVRERLRIAAVASRVRRARVGIVGSPVEGFDHVVTAADELQGKLGLTTVEITPGEFRDEFLATRPGRVLERARELASEYRLDTVGAVDLHRGTQAVLALEAICLRHKLDAGAMNCHVQEIRLGDEVGIAPCFALGCLTSSGIPWSCTGDVLTAIAMCVTSKLGGPTLYHELEALDYQTGEMVIANSGEHDRRWWPEGELPPVHCNLWFKGLNQRCSLCVSATLPSGPATLVAFVQGGRGGYRLVTARAELTGRALPATGTTNGALRFAADPVGSWERWVGAGAGHHSCLTNADRAQELRHLAQLLALDLVEIC